MSWDEYFMRLVYLAASKSKDRSTKIGAVIVREHQVVATGYNGFPSGVNDDVAVRHDRPLKYSWTEHAERNAIYCCARHGVSARGATMYTQGVPCADCARGVIQAGITKVITHADWGLATNPRWLESCQISTEMLKEAGVELLTIPNLTLDVPGFLDGHPVRM